MFKNRYFLTALILTLSLLWPLFAAPYFSHQDNVQTIRLFEMDQCIKDRQIPCRWVPDLGGGYGFPLFNYYGPLPYYIGEVFYFFTNNLLLSAKIMFAIPLICSFIFMYLFARKFWGNIGGSLSALFYSYAPYHALDMYVRGAMGELWGLMFFPAIGWGLVKLKEKQSLGNILLLGFFTALLIASHNLSAMLFLPLVILALLLIFVQTRNFKFLYFTLLSFLVGIMLSAFYLLPMVFEKNLVHLETTVEGYFSYTEHFKGLKKLLVERDWTYGDSVREVPGGQKDGLSYQIGWVHLLGWLLSLISAKILWKKQRNLSVAIVFSSVAILFSILMIHPRSEFIWKLIDPLKYVQFPWRFLLLIIFFISFLGGSILVSLQNKKWIHQLWVILTVLVVILNFSFFRPQSFINLSDQDILTGSNFNRLKMYAIFDYLPNSAKFPPAGPADAPYKIIAGDSIIKNFAKGTDWMKFETNTRSHTIVRLSQYYFPQWKILVDGQEVLIDYKNDLGLMTVLLGAGNHTIDAKLHDTPIRSLGNLVSGLGIVIFIVFCLLSFKQGRQRLTYYLKAFKG